MEAAAADAIPSRDASAWRVNHPPPADMSRRRGSILRRGDDPEIGSSRGSLVIGYCDWPLKIETRLSPIACRRRTSLKRVEETLAQACRHRRTGGFLRTASQQRSNRQ
jgi:hypothetical protein